MDKDFLDIIKFSIGTIVIALGWLAAHYFTNRRDRIAKRRDISLEHLITAYRVLTDEISHRDSNEETLRKFELILTDIQLFGSQEQIALAIALIEKAEKENKISFDLLILNLRNDLRKQLGLSKVSGNIKWMRFPKNSYLIDK